jgi:2-methylcitrate dehydratase PrpD
MWNMRKRHFSHSWKTPAAEASVKAVRSLRAAQRAERSGEPLRMMERRVRPPQWPVTADAQALALTRAFLPAL